LQNNKATGYDGIPAEAGMMIVTKHERTEFLTKLFSMIRNIRKFPKKWIIALIQPIYNRKGTW